MEEIPRIHRHRQELEEEVGCDFRYELAPTGTRYGADNNILGPGAAVEGNAQYVPSFGAPQLFRWKGHWVEITRLKDSQIAPYGNYKSFSSLHLMCAIFTILVMPY